MYILELERWQLIIIKPCNIRKPKRDNDQVTTVAERENCTPTNQQKKTCNAVQNVIHRYNANTTFLS